MTLYFGAGAPDNTIRDADWLLDGETDGFAIDARMEGGAVSIKDTARPYNNASNQLLDSSNIKNLGTSPKRVKWNTSPYLRWTLNNLFLQSQAFDNASWTKGQNMTVTVNAISAPGGSPFSYKLVEPASLNSPSIGGVTVVVGFTYNISAYFKTAGNSRYIELAGGGLAGASECPNFNVDAGSVSLAGTSVLCKSATITDAGDGWYRCSAVVVPSATSFFQWNLSNSSSDHACTSYTGDGTSGVYIWGAQLSRGDTLQTYHATTTAAWYGVPQQYDAAAGYFGLRLERAATNLILRSQELDNAAWFKGSDLTVTADATTAPDGTTTADLYVPNAVNATHTARNNTAFTLTAVIYTWSIYAKAAGYNFASLNAVTGVSAADRYSATINLTTGVITQNDSAGSPLNTASAVEDVGDGWYRIIVQMLATTTASASYLHFSPSSTGTPTMVGNNPSYAGDAVSGVYFWGAQLELASNPATPGVPTSYIQTITTSVSRSADGCSLPPATFPNSSASAPMTVYIDLKRFHTLTGTGGQRHFFFSRTASFQDVIQSRQQGKAAPDEEQQLVAVTNVQQMAATQVYTAVAANTRYQITAAFATNNAGYSMNGGAEKLDTVCTMPTALTTYMIGSEFTPDEHIIGLIYRVIIVPRRVSNTDTWRYNYV